VIDVIVDTGPLVGALDRDDQWCAWAAKEFATIRQPSLFELRLGTASR
jgi:hypothetical protein